MSGNQVTIHLPADTRWLSLLRASVLRYTGAVGFSRALEHTVMQSVMEACEELMRVADQNHVPGPFTVMLDYRGDAVVIELEYGADIPLNPYDTEDYEVPGEDTDLETVSTDVLWLFLIKKRMDRVFFRVQGSKRVLSMMHYQREEGKEKRFWIMALRPRLRGDLELHLKDAGEAHPGSVLQKIGGGVLILGPKQTFFVRNMDGEKSFHDLYMEHIDAIGLVSPELPRQLYEKLERMKMLAPEEEDAGQVWWKRAFHTIVNPSFSIPRANKVITEVYRRTRFFFTPLGVALILLMGFSGLYPLWRMAPQFVQALTGLEKAITHSPQILLWAYALTLIHVCFHELGHGTVCKHYGGKVTHMGLMFYLAFFIFYCDTTAAYTFPEKRQRIRVSLGGPMVSFAIFGLGLWAAWGLSGTGLIWESVFILFSVFNFVVLIMNFNPLIKMDAYYILLDYTGVHNLRERSFRFIKRKLFGWLGYGFPRDIKVASKEKRLFWWYGTLGGVFTLLFVAYPLIKLFHVLEDKSHHNGQLLYLIVIVVLLLLRLGTQAYKGMKNLWQKEYILK